MTPCGTKNIETERLLLRRYVPEDAAAMFRNWASDPEVTKYLTWPPHETAAVTEQVVNGWTARYGDASYYHWAIVRKAAGPEPVGDIAAVSKSEGTGRLEIGYCLSRACWGQGIMPEALAAVISFLFREAGADCVAARHDPKNPKSGRVMQKCGMRFEGTLRAADRNNTGVCDASYYSILRAEWEAGAR